MTSVENRARRGLKRGHWSLSAALVLAACAAEPEAGAPPTDDHAEETVVRLRPEQMAAAGVTVAPVERRRVTGTIQASAVVEAVPDRTARVGSRVGGRVVAVRVNVGDRVRAGADLALIDSPELGRAKADFLAALAGEEVARQTADREERLFRERISAEREWREAEAAAIRARTDREAAEARLHALGLSDEDLGALATERHYDGRHAVINPLDGVVVERRATIGETVTPTDVLFNVMDLSTVWLQAEVYDDALAGVAVGQRVLARTRAWPDRTFLGRVDNIGAVLDPTTRAVRVRVVVPNAEGLLRPGMFTEVAISQPLTGDSAVLTVPAAAIQDDGTDTIVFVVRAPGVFERRVVRLGDRQSEWAIVLDGLAPEDSVVVGGAFALKAESRKGELGEGHGH